MLFQSHTTGGSVPRPTVTREVNPSVAARFPNTYVGRQTRQVVTKNPYAIREAQAAARAAAEANAKRAEAQIEKASRPLDRAMKKAQTITYKTSYDGYKAPAHSAAATTTAAVTTGAVTGGGGGGGTAPGGAGGGTAPGDWARITSIVQGTPPPTTTPATTTPATTGGGGGIDLTGTPSTTTTGSTSSGTSISIWVWVALAGGLLAGGAWYFWRRHRLLHPKAAKPQGKASSEHGKHHQDHDQEHSRRESERATTVGQHRERRDDGEERQRERAA